MEMATAGPMVLKIPKSAVIIDANPTMTVPADAAMTTPMTLVVRRTVTATGSPAARSSR